VSLSESEPQDYAISHRCLNEGH